MVIMMANKKKDKKHLNSSSLIERYTVFDFQKGLTSEIVEKRKEQNLVNKIKIKQGKSIGRIIFDNIFTFF